jgi:hypothetical protein
VSLDETKPLRTKRRLVASFGTLVGGGTMTTRHHSTTEALYDFMDEILVVCPRCSGCARHHQVSSTERPGWFAPRQLACPACGYAKGWNEREIARRSAREPFDDYFGLPLWLVEICRGRPLWFLNARHLHEVESFVRADLRERAPDVKFGWANQSWASRLPAWVKSAKYRTDVLRSLATLRLRIPPWGAYPK